MDSLLASDSATARRACTMAVRGDFLRRLPLFNDRIWKDVGRGQEYSVRTDCLGSRWNHLVVLHRANDRKRDSAGKSSMSDTA